MPTSYTPLLGLALPATGELLGTWGSTVNTEITSLLDAAVAGTTTLSADADVTLTTTTGAANQARQAIILWTANGTVTRNITAPATSKSYVVINNSAGAHEGCQEAEVGLQCRAIDGARCSFVDAFFPAGLGSATFSKFER